MFTKTKNTKDEEPPPLYLEIKKAINELKINKHPSCDEIAAEMIKVVEKMSQDSYRKLFTSIWRNKQ